MSTINPDDSVTVSSIIPVGMRSRVVKGWAFSDFSEEKNNRIRAFLKDGQLSHIPEYLQSAQAVVETWEK